MLLIELVNCQLYVNIFFLRSDYFGFLRYHDTDGKNHLVLSVKLCLLLTPVLKYHYHMTSCLIVI